MALIAFRRFAGGQPRLNARLLNPMNAQYAVNARFDNGKVRALRRPKQESLIVNAGPIQSIYRYRGGGKDGWLSWDTDVDVIRAPLAGDDFGRIYLTGDGRPKFGDSKTVITPQALGSGSTAPGATTFTVAASRGYFAGDPIEIEYSPSVKQQVTCVSFATNGTMVVTPVTTGTVNNTTIVRNLSQRYPIYLYDLGVPAPATALTTTILDGVVEGTEGVAQGDIVAVSDIVVSNTTGQNTATVSQIQDFNGGFTSWGLGKHNPYYSVPGIVLDGQPVFIEGSAEIRIKISAANETRQVSFKLRRNPATTNILVADQNNPISRPTGGGLAAIIAETGVNPLDPWVYKLKVEGIDAPVAGSYTYRIDFGPVPGVAGDNNNGYVLTADWALKVRYTNRVKLTLGSGHGLTVGEQITLTLERTPDTRPDQDLNGKTVEVISVDGNDIVVAGVFGGKYVPGGKWKKSYTVDETQDRAYVYTYVAEINGQTFESSPSPASPVITMALSGTVRLTGFINPTSPTLLWETNFTALRIYRLNPGETVQAEYLFLDEVPITTTQYDDDVLGEDLGEVLRSTSWELPPDNLRGIIELPEGGAAGFTDKEFCMAEPYFIHAWPALNRRTTHDEIVALCAFGSSIGITTKGRPSIVTGMDPATVSMEHVEISMPNLSKRGTVDLGYACVYPSANGLALLAVARAENATAALFSANDWRALKPSSFIGAELRGQYLAFYDATTVDPEYPSTEVAYKRPIKGGVIIDPHDPGAGVVFLDFWASEAWTDPRTKKLYVVDGSNIKEFDADRMELEYTWLSPETPLPHPVSMGWGKVEAKRYPLRFAALANGEVIHSRIVRNSEPFRLPPVIGDIWSIEIQGCHELEAVFLAEVIEDFDSAGGG